MNAASSQSPTSGEYITRVMEGATLVDGKQTWELAEGSKNDLGMMLRCCEAELETMKRAKVVAAPFYFERAALLLRKAKHYEREIEICETYIEAVHEHYSSNAQDYEADVRKGPRFLALQARVPKARALLSKTKGAA